MNDSHTLQIRLPYASHEPSVFDLPRVLPVVTLLLRLD
jgi:hypothetical protein